MAIDADELFEMVESGKFQNKRVFVEASDDDVCGITYSRTLEEIINEEIIAYMLDDKELDKVSKQKIMVSWLSEKKNNRFPNLSKLACLFLSVKLSSAGWIDLQTLDSVVTMAVWNLRFLLLKNCGQLRVLQPNRQS